MKSFLSLLCLSALGPVLSKSLSDIDLSAVSGQWTSLSKTVAFKPSDGFQDSKLLRNAQRRFLLGYYEDNFVDGMETQYSPYAQAWRLLGFYTDCDAVAEEQRRKLEDNEDENGDNADDQQQQDEEAEEEEQEADQQEEEENNGRMCKRYLLWAAYVDMDYEGNGLSEYQIYNVQTKSWDKTACESGESDRCAKMDCHQWGSRYKLIGYFREDNPVNFLEALSQHQGSCSWSDGSANAVADCVEWLPQQCTETEVAVSNGNIVYFDLKPRTNGGVDVGLYTDNICSEEYTGSETTVDAVLTTHYGYEVASEQTLYKLNQALDDFKVCTPCRTYDFNSYYQADEDGEDNGEEDNGEEEQDGNDANANMFVCQDDAGYNGVNQCMMFAQNTRKASSRDVSKASQQGTIARTYDAVDATESWWEAWGFLLISILIFLIGILLFCSVAVKRKRVSSSSRSEPLISSRQ